MQGEVTYAYAEGRFRATRTNTTQSSTPVWKTSTIIPIQKQKNPKEQKLFKPVPLKYSCLPN